MAILPCHVNKGQRRVIKNQTIMNNEERHDSPRQIHVQLKKYCIGFCLFLELFMTR